MSTDADNNINVTGDPVIITSPEFSDVKRSVKPEGSGVSGMIIVGIVVIVMLMFGVFAAFRSARNADSGKAVVASVQAPIGGLPTDPATKSSATYKDLIATENAEQVAAAQLGKSDVVLPPMIGGTTSSSTYAIETPPQSTSYRNVVADRSSSAPAARNPQYDDRVRAKLSALKALSSGWSAMEAHSTTAGVTPDAQTALSVSLDSDASRPAPISFPLVTVLPAIVEVGANTDYPGKVVFRLSGQWRGIKLLGDVEASRSTGASDRLVLRVSEMFWQDRSYAIEGFAVDPKTSIPAVKGDTNHHILFNAITQSAAAFLAGYSSGLGQQRLAVATDGSDVFLGGMSSSSLLRQQGAGLVGNQLDRMQYRRTTVTLPAGRTVGIVFTQQPTISASGRAVASTQTQRDDDGMTYMPNTVQGGFGGTPSTGSQRR